MLATAVVAISPATDILLVTLLSAAHTTPVLGCLPCLAGGHGILGVTVLHNGSGPRCLMDASGSHGRMSGVGGGPSGLALVGSPASSMARSC